MDGVGDQVAKGVQKGEIHAPGVNADGLEAALCFGLADALLDLEEQARGVPVKGAVHLDRVVCKAVDLFEGDGFSVEAA